MDYLLIKIKNTNKYEFLPYTKIVSINEKYKIPISTEKRLKYYLNNCIYESRIYSFLNKNIKLKYNWYEINFPYLTKSNEGHVIPQNLIQKYYEHDNNTIYYLFPAYNLQGLLVNENNTSWIKNIHGLKIVQFSQYYWLYIINMQKTNYPFNKSIWLFLLKDNYLYDTNIYLNLFDESIIINSILIRPFFQYYINQYEKQIMESINKFKTYIGSQILANKL